MLSHTLPRLLLTQVPAAFEAWLRERSAALGIEVVAVADPATVDVPVDDLILLAPDAELIEATSPKLADFGVCALIGEGPLARKVNVDVGRVHYNRWVYVGGTSPDVARAYADRPVRSALKQGGSAWFIGAGGPMGRMHVAARDPGGRRPCGHRLHRRQRSAPGGLAGILRRGSGRERDRVHLSQPA